MTATLLTTQKPAMKWVGNKMGTPVIDRVRELYEPFRDSATWKEPFVGIGGALLAIDPPKAICCDASSEVIGLHKWIRDGGQCIPFPETWTETDYAEQRSRFQEMQSEYAASPDFVDADKFFSLMIWLNKACFNGLWRVNNKGEFNVPVGKKADGTLNKVVTPTLPTYRQSWQFHDVSIGFVECSDRSFIYADPPYWGTHSAYTAKGFGWADQVELAKWLEGQNCPAVASNSSAPEILALYESLGFTIELIPVRRSISCKGGDRAPAVEMLTHKNCGV